MLGSLSSGSSGPRPVISSRISETNSLSSWVLSASRSTTMYCVTSCWMCARISSSGSFSSAEQVDLLDQPTVQANLGVEQLVGMQRIDRLSRHRLILEQARARPPSTTSAPEQAAGAPRPPGRPRVGCVNRRGEAAAHALFASDSASLPARQTGGHHGAAVLAICGSISFLSWAVMLLPGLTSSSGTPRSIASRTSR